MEPAQKSLPGWSLMEGQTTEKQPVVINEYDSNLNLIIESDNTVSASNFVDPCW